MMNLSRGIVYFVGSGPGDPGLITLRGVDRLRQADVILYDYLVNPDVLVHASSQAELVCLGRHGRSTAWSQEAINEKLVHEAQEGKTVVRLKGGDPMVFGRAGEEIDALNQHQIRFEVVPGVTAALAGAAYAGIPITDRKQASAVALITGQETTSKSKSSIDYGALARFPGTLVFYMGITTSRHWTGELLQAGMPPETPVTLLRRCSWPDQRTIRCKLHQVADRVTPYSKFPPPAIAIVGNVNHHSTQSWFEQKPLFGLSVLVTRPRHQSSEMAQQLHELGANTVLQPAIEIQDPADWSPLDDAIHRLANFDWIVFSSSNAVHRFLQRVFDIGLDIRAFGQAKLAAVGSSTSEALAQYHLHVDVQPQDSFRSEGLVAALADSARGQRFLLPRANRGRELLAERLTQAGAEVETVVVYRHVDIEQADSRVSDKLSAGEIDWITITSSAIADSLVQMFGNQLQHARLATISPLTSAAVRRHGLDVAAEAKLATTHSLIEAILTAQGQRW